GYAVGWPGAYGSCYGYGGGYGGLTSFTCGGNYGCYGGYACYGIPTPTEGGVIVDPNVPHSVTPVIPSTAPAPVPMGNPPPPKASLENKVRSRVIIETPENAKLYVDGQLMQTASSHRVFQTPELAPGSTYFYDLKIEVVREGKTLTEEKRIYVRPGIEQSVAFSMPAVRSDIATVSAGRE
ncbi:MAG TPA: TIGR03000 domain-containing protein, partial [Gemmataceae bacterium]|nr:TIGR03000 domain-containing protein [Gemmataceae bacterium]